MIKMLIRFGKGVIAALKDPEYQLLVGFTLLVTVGGTVFYHFYEQWSWVDSAYFVVVALTTVGFGDYAPSTELSRGVTILFLFFGVAWLGAFISLMVKGAQERHAAKLKAEGKGDDS